MRYSIQVPQIVTGMANSADTNTHINATNIYVRGLEVGFDDAKLFNLGIIYGEISSCKAIIDKQTDTCKGYGFIDYHYENSAKRALTELRKKGFDVQIAAKQEKDHTNLYFSGLPTSYSHEDLSKLLTKIQKPCSTRILYDAKGDSKRVGFSRMTSNEACNLVIKEFNGQVLEEQGHPLIVKFADKSNHGRDLQNFDSYQIPTYPAARLDYFPSNYGDYIPLYYPVDWVYPMYYPYEPTRPTEKTENSPQQTGSMIPPDSVDQPSEANVPEPSANTQNVNLAGGYTYVHPAFVYVDPRFCYDPRYYYQN